jgi:sigma-B regulation protein RsbU (phosphoserine phosphatase)
LPLNNKTPICQLRSIVTKPIPQYLRLHLGDEPSESVPSDADRQKVDDFWNAFSDATGWRVAKRTARLEGTVELIPAVTTETTENLEAEPDTAVSRKAATQLAQLAADLEQELSENREALRHQEVELAMRAPILIGESDRANLADRIEKTLSEAAAACGCDAAAMYLLDDDTQYLKTRAVFGLPPQRLEQPPRALRGSRGDLEAMVQIVVTIDDMNECSIDTWNCPESSAEGPFAAGICAAITSDDVPVGTLWLFRNERAEFGIAESAAARLAATQVSLELSSASLERKESDQGDGESIRDVAQWQFDGLPIGAELADGWRVDGMLESPRPWATGWHVWDILPDGTLMLAIAEAVDDSVKGALNSTIARAALTAHSGYRHTPSQLLQRVGDTLWQTSTGEQLVSMLYMRVDLETGEGEVASSGTISAMIGSKYGYRPLVHGCGDPLNTYIDANCVTESFRMMEGETLLAHSCGLVTNGTSQTMLGDGIRTAMQGGDKNPLAQIRRKLINVPLNQERGAVTLLRE